MTDHAEDAQARARALFDELVADIRPELHRYCARMVASSIEGEDIVQDALARAYYRFSRVGGVRDLRGWLFRIAHNRAVDHLRSYGVRFGERLDSELPGPPEGSPLEKEEMTRLGLAFFAKLTVMQRSSVILKDVLGYTLDEISGLLDASVPAIKGALHRGRASLRRMSVQSPGERGGPTEESAAPDLTGAEARLLERYARHFNAREFDALRDMLADDARLDMVGRVQVRGSEAVGDYYTRYEKMVDCRVRPGVVERRPALLGRDDEQDERGFFVLIEWDDERVLGIRDFRYARWVLDEAGVKEVP